MTVYQFVPPDVDRGSTGVGGPHSRPGNPPQVGDVPILTSLDHNPRGPMPRTHHSTCSVVSRPAWPPRRFALLAVFLGTSLLVAACGGAARPSASPPPSPIPGDGGPTPPAGVDGRIFLSTQVLVDGRERPLVPGTRVRLEFSQGRLGASAGCNRLGGAYRLDGDVLRLADAAVTEMGCDPARHDQDEWLFTLLGSAPTVSLAGDTLTLRLGSTIIALLDRRVAEPDLPLVGPSWRLTSILAGEVVSSVPPGVVARLEFGADGRLAVDTGCNTGGGTYRLEGDRLVVDLALTKRLCLGPAGQVEAAVIRVLQAREVVVGIEASTLRLVAGSAGLDFVGEGSLD